MPRVFVGNFDFEHDLTAPTATEGLRLAERRRAARISAALASAWIAIAEPDDVVCVAAPFGPSRLDRIRALGLELPRFVTDLGAVASGPSWELVPWGWTHSLVQLAHSRGWSASAPDTEVVRTANSRRFRLQWEEEWGVGLAGARLVRTLGELESTVSAARDAPLGWVLKAEFGMSGRERMLGRGRQLGAPILNWAKRRLEHSGSLVFEPWVERIAEAGIQVAIPREGVPEIVGVTPLLCDRSGTYRGNRCACAASELARWQAATEIALRAAERLRGIGYFGPLGIDAMWYRDEAGDAQLRPLQDINARYTMGRLSLGFRRVLRPEQHASWLHFPLTHAKANQSAIADCDRRLPPGVSFVPTSPIDESSPNAVPGSGLLIAPESIPLESLEAQMFAELSAASGDKQ